MLPTQLTVGTIARYACTWEVKTRKAGNVCPGREYPDLTVNDFLLSAVAIAPILDDAAHLPIGVTILRGMAATCRVATSNTNLGILLLLGPLAAAHDTDDLQKKLRSLTVEDSRQVFAAIRLGNPSGLGSASEQSVHEAPTLPLREVMALARDRDLIAQQYVTDFALVHTATDVLVDMVNRHTSLERAIVETQLWFLSQFPDSHIARKRGIPEAIQVRSEAANIRNIGGLDTQAGRKAYVAMDAWLRSDAHARNPGTTADFLAASLFAALRKGAIPPTVPFDWREHPFG